MVRILFYSVFKMVLLVNKIGFMVGFSGIHSQSSKTQFAPIITFFTTLEQLKIIYDNEVCWIFLLK